MASSFNPKMLAHDVSKGLVYLNPTNLKKYTVADLKNILVHLSIVQREIRAKQIPPEEVMAMKEKNRQLQHINQAITVINSYAKKRHLQI